MRTVSISVLTALALALGSAHAQAPAAPAAQTAPAAKLVAGDFNSVAMISSSMLVHFPNGRSEVIRFDPDTLRVYEMDKPQKVAYLRTLGRGQAVSIEYVEKKGVKWATAVVARTVKSPSKTISVDDFNQLVKAPGQVQMVDLRAKKEVDTGAYPGVKWIAHDQLDDRMAEIARDQPVVLHCAGGVRAEMAYHQLANAGYSDVRFLNASVKFDKGVAKVEAN